MNLDQYLFRNINFCIEQLKQQRVIAFPTEAVFGLGCDPDSEKAVMNLLLLKQRPIEKGFILIGANYAQLAPYIAVNKLSISQLKNMFSSWPGPVTYVVPVTPGIPRWFTGCFNSLAIRVINHPVVYELCRKFGKPLISTSANLSGKRPCRNIAELKQQFGSNFPILYAETGKYLNPSEIRNAITGVIIRQG